MNNVEHQLVLERLSDIAQMFDDMDKSYYSYCLSAVINKIAISQQGDNSEDGGDIIERIIASLMNISDILESNDMYDESKQIDNLNLRIAEDYKL